VKIVLAQNLIHLPSHGGANRSNRLMLEQLAARGHTCHAVTPLSGALATTDPERQLDALRSRGAVIEEIGDDTVVYVHRGVTVHAVRSASRLGGVIGAVIGGVQPDRVLVPSDDPGHIVMSASLRAAPGRVIHMVHTLQQLPFGPEAFYPSAAGTAMMRDVAGTIAVSAAAQRYVREHAGIESQIIYPQVYGHEPAPAYGRFGHGAVTMVNPCGYKGLPILLGLADLRPDVAFLAVPTWGAVAEDLAELRRRPNITLADPVDDIDEIFARTGVLLMASLWGETFGYTCVEAMLRGIPVLASSVAGLVEAKLGVPGSLPVAPITGYAIDARQDRPVPIIPEQDIRPWAAALDGLRADEAHYAANSAASREAATAFVAGIDEGALESYLTDLPFNREAAIRILAARRRTATPPPVATVAAASPAEGS
jgi:glycosyltransferase involved in cell wall biosynthesis